MGDTGDCDLRSRSQCKDVNANRGPLVHVLDGCHQDRPQVFTFDRCAGEPCGPRAVGSDDVLLFRRGPDACPPVTVTPRLVLKAIALLTLLAATAWTLNWYALNFSKSSEVLSLLLLLLLHVYVLEPPNFLPACLYHQLRYGVAPVCRRPDLHPPR